MARTKKRRHKAAGDARAVTGTYVYDKAVDRVVKVSGRIPSVASKGKGKSAGAVGPCGRTECGGGVCAGGGADGLD